MRSGESKLAKKYYEKSLKLDPKNDNARKALENLKSAAGKK
jgi:Tfp pilus assembly protein PilF